MGGGRNAISEIMKLIGVKDIYFLSVITLMQIVSWVPSYRLKNFLVHLISEQCERAFIAGMIYLPKSDSLAFTRTFRERLKENAIVCAAGDAKVGKKFIPVQFLWLTDYFPTGLVSLAKLSGAAMLPLFCVQDAGDRTSIIIESPIYIDHDDDRERCLEKAVTQYVRLLESYIEKYPEQYRNWHGLYGPDLAG